MARVESISAWALGCLGAVLVGAGCFLVPANARADAGTTCLNSNCAGLSGNNLWGCLAGCCSGTCADGSDDSCVSDCCNSACSGDPYCVAYCNAGKTCADFSADCKGNPTFGACQPTSGPIDCFLANPGACACKWGGEVDGCLCRSK